MKKNLLLIALLMTFGLANAQFKVLLVDDDNYTSDESARIDTALAHSGYTYSYINIDTNAAPTYNDLKDYDMVIWTTANDGVNLNLWDTATQNGGTVKFNDALMQYLDSGKVLWVDGLDFIYDIYGKAPDTFHQGDFVYDVMGISAYTAQSHADDSLGTFTGCPLAQRASSNTVTTIDTIKWKWSSVWYADAFELTSTAVSLYEMGPAGYDFAGRSMALYNGNLISSTLRIGSIGDANGNYDQTAIDNLIKQMVDGAKNGKFAPLPSGVKKIEKQVNINVYPNPARNQVSFAIPDAKNTLIRIYDITGKIVAESKMAKGNSVYTFDVSNLNQGIYFYNVSVDNKIVTGKFSIIK